MRKRRPPEELGAVLLCRGLRRHRACKIHRTEKKGRCGEVGEESYESYAGARSCRVHRAPEGVWILV